MSEGFDTTFFVADGVEGDRHAIASIARRLASAAGHPPHVAAKFALAASELASNLARHGGGGSLRIATRPTLLLLETRNRKGQGLTRAPTTGYGLDTVRRAMGTVEFSEVDGTLVVVARQQTQET